MNKCNMSTCICNGAFWVDEYWIMNTGLKLQSTQTSPDGRNPTDNNKHILQTQTRDFLYFDWLKILGDFVIKNDTLLIFMPISPLPSFGESEVRGQLQYSTLGAGRDLVPWSGTFKQHGCFADTGSETSWQEVLQNCSFVAVWFWVYTAKIIFKNKRRWEMQLSSTIFRICSKTTLPALSSGLWPLLFPCLLVVFILFFC